MCSVPLDVVPRAPFIMCISWDSLSPEIPSSPHPLGIDCCCAAAVASSSVLRVVAEAPLYLSEESGLTALRRRPSFLITHLFLDLTPFKY